MERTPPYIHVGLHNLILILFIENADSIRSNEYSCSISFQIQHIPGVIYKGSSSVSVGVNYAPTVGDCSCKLYNDGHTDLLFHYKPDHLFYYGILFLLLSFLSEGRCPIATLWRSCNRANRYLSRTSLMPYQMLRGVWNSFIRMLDMDWQALSSRAKIVALTLLLSFVMAPTSLRILLSLLLPMLLSVVLFTLSVFMSLKRRSRPSV